MFCTRRCQPLANQYERKKEWPVSFANNSWVSGDGSMPASFRSALRHLFMARTAPLRFPIATLDCICRR